MKCKERAEQLRLVPAWEEKVGVIKKAPNCLYLFLSFLLFSLPEGVTNV